MSEWSNRLIGYDLVDADQLLANPANWRRHPNVQREALRGSLDDLGWIAPVIVNQTTGFMIDGHARAEEALARGAQVPVAYVELTPAEEAEALAILDPIGAMATADADSLDALLREITTGSEAIQKLLAGIAEGAGLYLDRPLAEDPGADLDHADELREKWGTEAGQLWELGPHRVLCGDATVDTDVQRLMGGGLCEMVWTDPPWNVAYGQSGTNPRWKMRTIENDNLGEAFPAFAADFCRAIAAVALPGAPIYMAMSAQEWPVIHATLTAAGFHWSSTIIWVKDHAVLSRKDYHTRYEPLWYGWREGAARLVSLDDRRQNDVWEIDRPTRSEEHPTMKPVELVARAIGNSSRLGNRVYDPFLGSGTTMVAAEQTDRVCYGLELEPKYVAVTLERMQGMGIEPSLLEG